jgi:SAM-dependent methyltransferase
MPESVVDVGCGLGHFLKAFKDKSISRVMGINGDWTPRDKLFQNIEPNEFIVHDLNQKLILNEKFDLAISLEVAEHLKSESALDFIDSLTRLSDIIIFSAATPLTWYDSSHLNNQWPPYWRKLFNHYGFEMYDVVRYIFINNEDVFPWYKTNMFLVTKYENSKIVSEFKRVYPREKYINRFTSVFYPQL